MYSAIIINIYIGNIDILNTFYKYLDPFKDIMKFIFTLSYDKYDQRNELLLKSKEIETRYPNSDVFVIINQGFDIGAFFFALEKVWNFNIVLRIHSKSNIHLVEDILNGLLGDIQKYEKVLRIFRNPKVGMIGRRQDIIPFYKNLFFIQNMYYLKILCKQYSISDPSDITEFVAFTFFWFRVKVFRKLFSKFTPMDVLHKMIKIDELDWYWYFRNYNIEFSFYPTDIFPEYKEKDIQNKIIEHWKQADKSKIAPNYYKARQMGLRHFPDFMLGNAYERFFGHAVKCLGYSIVAIN